MTTIYLQKCRDQWVYVVKDGAWEDGKFLGSGSRPSREEAVRQGRMLARDWDPEHKPAIVEQEPNQ